METIRFLLGDSDLDFKLTVLKFKARIFLNESTLSMMAANESIINNSNFWMTGAFISALVFFASKEKENVQWG